MTFPQISGSTAVRQINSFVVPTGANGMNADASATLGAYAPAADIPFGTVAPSNVAMIKLSVPLTFSASKIKLLINLNSKT